ncbi:hypothetical protein FH972_025628 [Carpinus fangiana]|uniref:Uncharacterized protein n=1 Tax=Carpinus fangiana TaxID=176857 RepID=A0A5N6L2J9_9ROSI|nr:hypothetical protein FH972_025628 [Carpinus fangiana]
MAKKCIKEAPPASRRQCLTWGKIELGRHHLVCTMQQECEVAVKLILIAGNTKGADSLYEASCNAAKSLHRNDVTLRDQTAALLAASDRTGGPLLPSWQCLHVPSRLGRAQRSGLRHHSKQPLGLSHQEGPHINSTQLTQCVWASQRRLRWGLGPWQR